MFKLNDLHNIHVISDYICAWGGYSLIQATLSMIKLGFCLEKNWSHALVISGSHLPLWPRDRIRSWLVDDFSLMNWCEFPDSSVRPDGWGGSIWDRYSWRYDEIPGQGMQRTYPVHSFGFVYATGSQWVSLSRSHAKYILSDECTDLKEKLSHTNVSDEAFFQTLLCNSSFSEQVIRKNSTYVVWDGKDSPRIFNIDEYVEASKNDIAPFARKFPDDLGDENEIFCILNSVIDNNIKDSVADKLLIEMVKNIKIE